MIDIHAHTTYSDGSNSVEEILRIAENTKLKYFSITDHNTVDAYYDSAMKHKLELFSGSIIPGVEITTTFNGEIVEILGYGFNLDSMRSKLHKRVLSFKQKQLKEYELIKQRYRSANVVFNEDNIIFEPSTESCRKSFWREIIKHPENVQRFANKSSIESSSKFTRQEVYNPDSHYYVDESSLYPTFQEVIDIIHSSNGIAFLAHLHIYANAIDIRNELLEITKRHKLDGIECYYSTFTNEQIIDLVNFCDTNSLLKSGGSDYHGTRKMDIQLGHGKGTLNVPESIIGNWPQNILDTKF